jgi:ribonuclease HI
MTLFGAADGPSSKGAKSPGRHFFLQFDGGSRGNPGPAGIGVTITTPTGDDVYELGEFLGSCTNNVAEYTALIRGLEAAIALNASQLTVKADSELVVRQIKGIYKVKSPDLKPLFERAKKLMANIPKVAIDHVYRSDNSRADALANLAMDRKTKVEPLGPAKAT